MESNRSGVIGKALMIEDREEQFSIELSVVVPAYNEGTRIPASLPKIVDYLAFWGRSYEVIVVDDGSTDNTVAVVEAFARNTPHIRVLKAPKNRGKGAVVRMGMLAARGDWVLFSDADLSAPIEELETMVPFLEDGYDVAIGSRALRRELIGVHQSAFRESAGKLFNVAMRAISGLEFRDTQCGFKLFTRRAAHSIFQQLTVCGFGFDVEALYLAKKLGFRTAEVAVRWNHMEASRVRPLQHGMAMFLDVIRIRWNDWTGRYSKTVPEIVRHAATEHRDASL